MAKGPIEKMTVNNKKVPKIVPLAGCSDRLSLRPGETIGFKVSSTLTTDYTAWLTRSICADPNPEGIGIVEETVADGVFPQQSFPSRLQPFHPGSYALTEAPVSLSLAKGVGIAATIFPTLAKEIPQTVLSIARLTLFLDESGCVAVKVDDAVLSTWRPLHLRHWYRLEATYDPHTQCLVVRQIALANPRDRVEKSLNNVDISDCPVAARVSIAARWDGTQACDHFNGKIESPGLYKGSEISPENMIALWDFAINTPSTTVFDTGPGHYDAALINFPARAMTGSQWQAQEMCWRHAPEHYGAIHFHDDDIYDFNWETDFTFTVPEDLPSGVYVMHIQSEEHQDAMPFYVCAPKGKPRAKLCVLIPTFTYTVYGNHARIDYEASWRKRISNWNAYPNNPAEYPHYGLSSYNLHCDGSGICHASHRRPLFNLRPGYLTFGTGEGSGLRHFQADSHLISWLHAKNIDYDVITDQELHEEGLSSLQHYAVLMTTSHPEYHTVETLDALQAYRDFGGHLLYLGGNGFYWRIALHSQAEGMLEIRRGETGIRTWTAEPGEYYNAFDGTYGGLWRRSGRPPQKLVGVGFSAQGEFNSSYYLRTCYELDYQWIFEGVDDKILGNFGFSGGGAAGFELDRIDPRLGTPKNAVLLARSEKHSDDFVLVPEEQLTHLTNLPGEPTKSLLRADMIYFDVPGGGSVFATGSITFCGSLPWNNFDNNISRILENVVSRKLRRG